MPEKFPIPDSSQIWTFEPEVVSEPDTIPIHPGDAIRAELRPEPTTVLEFRPSGVVAPGLRQPWGDATSLRAFSPFSPSDLEVCYPMPDWVGQRLQGYPQAPDGDALHDPLPIPFTADETKAAVLDVWRGAHVAQTRNCALVSDASFHIASLVLRVLTPRSGGWVQFDTRYTLDPLASIPYRVGDTVANLQCLLYRLAGKPLPRVYDGACLELPPRVESIYQLKRLRTTFAPQAAVQTQEPAIAEPSVTRTFPSQPDGPNWNSPPLRVTPTRHSQGLAARPDTYAQGSFEISRSFRIKEECECGCKEDRRCGSV